MNDIKRIDGRFAIVGIGETAYSRRSMKTTRAMGVEAVRNAMADAGLPPDGIDGMLSYHSGDSTASPAIADDLGIRLNFYMDCTGGGTSTETLVGLAMGAIEMGLCHTVALFRSMNGYSEVRRGGTGARAATPVRGTDLVRRPYGMTSAAQGFAPTFVRHMMEFGTTCAQAAAVKVAHSKHASNNPRALMRQRVTVEDVLASRWIVKPIHLLDCCLETDNACSIIVTSADRARDLRQRPVYVMGVAGRVSRPFADYHYSSGPITTTAAAYAAPRVFAQAGISPADVDITACYDAFTWTTLLLLEDFGFCKKGEGGPYVASGAIELGGRRPNNTSGGQLCEGYTHGMSLVIENVRQLRHQADDSCPGWERGEHSHDYREGGCRQVKDAEITMNMGWAGAQTTSGMILRRG